MKVKPFTLGADPEFMCMAGPEANAAHTHADDGDNAEEFGLDGSSQCYEVRPAPSVSPIQLVHNIHQVFMGQVARQPAMLDYNWRAGSHAGHPLGGHIHFGIRGFDEDESRANEYGVVLDDYVGAVTALIEDREEGVKRRTPDQWGQHYGKGHDCRVNKWGFEYRTPSSWLTSPYVAAGVLSLAKVVMHQTLNKRFKHKARIGAWDFSTMDTDTLRVVSPAIWSDIRAMELYPKYKTYLDFLYRLVEMKRNWFPKSSMKDSWGIVNLDYPMTFDLSTIWARYRLNPDTK